MLLNKEMRDTKHFPLTLRLWRFAMDTIVRDGLNPADGVECIQSVDLTLPIGVELPLIPSQKIPYPGNMRRLTWLEQIGVPREQHPSPIRTLGHRVKGLWVSWPSADEKILQFHSPTGCTRRRDTATDVRVSGVD